MHENQLHKQLSPRKIDPIGAQVTVLERDAQISPSEVQAEQKRPLPPSLKRIAALLTYAAPWYVDLHDYEI